VRRLDRGGSPHRKVLDHQGACWALCPYHDDTHPTNIHSALSCFSAGARGFHCFACGASGSLSELAEKVGVALFQCFTARDSHPPPPLTLESYAAYKQLPVPFLKAMRLRTVYLHTVACVAMPYYDAAEVGMCSRMGAVQGLA